MSEFDSNERRGRGRPPRHEASMTEEMFKKACSMMDESRVDQKNLDAAYQVLVVGRTSKEVGAERKISRQYLYRVMSTLWDRLNGVEEVTERLPADAAQLVRDLAKAYREGGDVDKFLEAIKEQTNTLKQAADAIRGVKRTLS